MPNGKPNLHGKQLAQLLRQIRADAQMSGRELARRSYISQAKISRIESGEVTPSLADIESVIRALNVTDDLASTLRDLAMRSVTEHRCDSLCRAVWHFFIDWFLVASVDGVVVEERVRWRVVVFPWWVGDAVPVGTDAGSARSDNLA